MKTSKVGNTWLKDYFDLSDFVFTHYSYIGDSERMELLPNGSAKQVYGLKYAPDNTVFGHLVFSLKYDNLDLSFFKAVFERIPSTDIINYISGTPSGKYARKIGFLYEFITQKSLLLSVNIVGNYVDLLEKKKYYTGHILKNSKWKINDNLLGNSAFCPIIRRITSLQKMLEWNIATALEQLRHEFPKDIFKRTTSYLYLKETKSSYEIEREKPSADRMERFVALLTKAGAKTGAEVLSEVDLTALQNVIIDPRFAAKGFRDFQNYIGESLPNYTERIHYVCPPPQYVTSLMEGLKKCDEKSKGTPAVVWTTIVSFGFIFIHPFEDGNGRLHRFLIHDTLVRSGVVPEGAIIPVSAYMLNNMVDYDQILEHYSMPLMKKIKYHKTTNEELIVENPQAVEGYYRYPDLTQQCIYIAKIIQETLTIEMPNELLFIQRYDEFKQAIQNIIDMPDKTISKIILFIHQNSATLPKRRRKLFDKLTDEEIIRIEAAYQEIFEVEK